MCSEVCETVRISVSSAKLWSLSTDLKPALRFVEDSFLDHKIPETIPCHLCQICVKIPVQPFEAKSHKFKSRLNRNDAKFSKQWATPFSGTADCRSAAYRQTWISSMHFGHPSNFSKKPTIQLLPLHSILRSCLDLVLTPEVSTTRAKQGHLEKKPCPKENVEFPQVTQTRLRTFQLTRVFLMMFKNKRQRLGLLCRVSTNTSLILKRKHCDLQRLDL